MRTLSVWSLISGVHSAAFFGQWQDNDRIGVLRPVGAASQMSEPALPASLAVAAHYSASSEPALPASLAVAAHYSASSESVVVREPPNFIARGFLEHQKNSSRTNATEMVTRRKHVARGKNIASVRDKCQKFCGKGIDLGCIPECQVRMFACMDYDRKTKDGELHLKNCELDVLKTYQQFSENWDSAHPQLVELLSGERRGQLNGADIEPLQVSCDDACGEGVDSSCVPECQVKMYQCLDHDRKTPEGLKKFTACKQKVLQTYKDFAADWNATHPYLLAIGQHATAKQIQQTREQCVVGCGSVSKKSCAPRCQTAMYGCLSIDATEASGAAALKECNKEVFVKTAKAEAKSNLTTYELGDIDKACASSCPFGMGESCMVECSMQMYECVDKKPVDIHHQNSSEHLKCNQAVLMRYRKYASSWNAAHTKLLSMHGHARAETLEDAQDDCKEACGVGVDSSCVPECQVKMYMCLDHDRKGPGGAKKYEECRREILAAYEKFADDWEAAHPYLLAIRRHVSEVELLHVQDKCAAACGTGVDSTCVPECQVELYNCLDHDKKIPEGKKAYENCEAGVIAEYKKFGEKWDEKHPY